MWSRAEIEDILGPRDAEFFALTYDVTPGGNFEGHNILNRLASLAKQRTRLKAPPNRASPRTPARPATALAAIRRRRPTPITCSRRSAAPTT